MARPLRIVVTAAAVLGALTLPACTGSAGNTGAPSRTGASAPTSGQPSSSPASSTSPSSPAASPSTSSPPAALSAVTYPGAAALSGAAVPAGVDPLPSLAAAPTDQPPGDLPCQTRRHDAPVKMCTFGDTRDPRLTIAVVGDSAVGQWMGALTRIADRQRWKLVELTHSQCPWTAVLTVDRYSTEPYTVCQTWGRDALADVLDRIHPSVVITSDRPVIGLPSHPKVDAQTQVAIGRGMATYWTRLADVGITVVPIRETPEMSTDVPKCLATHPAADCSTPRADALQPTPPTTAGVQAMTGPAAGKVHQIDLSNRICDATTCSAHVGNILVYRDYHHLTNTYALTITPYLERALLAVPALAG